MPELPVPPELRGPDFVQQVGSHEAWQRFISKVLNKTDKHRIQLFELYSSEEKEGEEEVHNKIMDEMLSVLNQELESEGFVLKQEEIDKLLCVISTGLWPEEIEKGKTL